MTKNKKDVSELNSRYISTYIVLLPSIALAKVTSSAYSKSPPTGIPCANRVTAISVPFKSFEIYIAVASPSMEGFVAIINSFVSSFCSLNINSQS